MALQQALGTNIPKTGVRLPPSAPTTEAPDAGAEFTALQQKAQTQLEPLQQQRAQLSARDIASKQQTAREQGMLQQRQAEGEAGIQQQYAKRMAQAPQREMLQEKAQQEKDFFFRPSQEDGMMMASLASLVAVLGASIGRGGKGNAQGALAAMNGMMEGYQQGRDDIFKKEKAAFETNLKALRDQMVSIRNALQDYERTVITDRDTATANLRAELAKQGADFKTAQIEREGPLKQIPVLDAQIKQLERQIAGYDSKAADARTRAQSEQKRFQAQQDLIDRRENQRMLRQEAREAAVDARRAAKEEAGAVPKTRTMSDAQVVKIEGMSSVANGLEKLKRTFKPEFASLGFLGFGADLEVEARRRLGDAVGMEAARWWAAYNRLQAPNRHALFGATLTGNELKNYQSFTAKPSDAPEFVIGQLDDQIAYANDVRDTRVATYEAAGYRVPPRQVTDFERTLRGGTLPPPAGGTPAAAAPAGAPKEGDKASSKSGLPMVYRGGQWVYE